MNPFVAQDIMQDQVKQAAARSLGSTLKALGGAAGDAKVKSLNAHYAAGGRLTNQDIRFGVARDSLARRRAGAGRGIHSVDPAMLREGTQGAAMVERAANSQAARAAARRHGGPFA